MKSSTRLHRRSSHNRRIVAILGSCALLAIDADGAKGQCPDGTPGPCRGSVRPDTNVFVVMPFVVSGPASAQYLGGSMVDLLHMALDGVGRMRIENAPTTLRRLTQLRDPRDVETASSVALEVGAGRVIVGTVVALGSDVRIRAGL